MANRPEPVFRFAEEVLLIGTMATYNSQAEASEGIPNQWREFRAACPALENSAKFYVASPCTDDGKAVHRSDRSKSGFLFNRSKIAEYTNPKLHEHDVRLAR